MVPLAKDMASFGGIMGAATSLGHLDLGAGDLLEVCSTT
jgi:hypothetical protein